MRLALIQCPPWGSLPPLGTASLKASTELHGHQVRCIDLNIQYCQERRQDIINDVGGTVYARPDPWNSGSFDEWDFDFDGEVRFKSALQKRPLPVQRWVDQVLEFAPEAVGFSVQSSNLGVTLQMAQHLARCAPSVPIIFGGPNVAQAQQGSMALETGIPDVVVEGEGEVTLLELLESFESGADLAGVAGIGRLVDGRVVWNEGRPLLKSINDLPYPDFSDIDWSLYPNPYEIPIMTSRGCVLNCAFCYETVYWKRFRTQSADRIVAEIEHQIASHPMRSDVEDGPAQFGMSFADSLVNGHLGGLRRMAQLLIDRSTGVYWNGQATINNKMDDAFFQDLARSGCTGLSFGQESGSPLVLESMGKKFDVREANEFFRRVERSGIELIVNIMVGFPTETRRDFVATLQFLTGIRQQIYMVNNVGPTSVVGGSRIHDDPDQFGVVPVDLPGWNAGTDFRWESAPAGNEKNRMRRLKILHLWMTIARIPHQRIGPSRLPWRRRVRQRQSESPSEATASDPVPMANAPRPPKTITRSQYRASFGDFKAASEFEPLLVLAADGRVSRVAVTPAWADHLNPQSWTGMVLDEMRMRVAEELGGEVDLTQTHDGRGIVSVTMLATSPAPDRLRGFKIRAFPPERGSGELRVALVPLGAEVGQI